LIKVTTSVAAAAGVEFPANYGSGQSLIISMWHWFCCKFLREYNSEIILKIGQHLSKLWTNV